MVDEVPAWTFVVSVEEVGEPVVGGEGGVGSGAVVVMWRGWRACVVNLA